MHLPADIAWPIRYQQTEEKTATPEVQDPVQDIEQKARKAKLPKPKKEVATQRAEGLRPEEAEDITHRTVGNMVDLAKQIDRNTGGVQSFIEAAKAGRIKRGWYQDYANIAHQLFPNHDDAHRFTALLAATSPRISVLQNLRLALDIWKEWHDAGRPKFSSRETGAKFLREVQAKWEGLGRKVPYIDPETGHEAQLPWGKHPTFPSHVNNTLSALMYGGDWKEFRLSGPKVNSFFQNLVGNLDKSTNDSWMANFAGISQEFFSEGKKWGYHTFTSYVRQAANQLNADLPKGERPWTPAEVQETVWSFFRGLSRTIGLERRKANKEGRKPRDPADIVKELTNGDINEGIDFLTEMFNNEEFTLRLKALGFGKQLEGLRRVHQELSQQKAPSLGQRAVEDPSRIPQSIIARASQLARQFQTGRLRNARKGVKLRYNAPLQAEPTPAGGDIELPPTTQTGDTNFFSPNTDEQLTFDQAYSRLHSSNQKSYQELSQKILEQANVKAYRSLNAVGDWSDGAENSIVHVLPKGDPDLTKYLAAWQGLLFNQKAVLHFASDPKGQDSVYQIQLDNTNTQQVREALNQFGINYRTIIPKKDSNTVLIYDQGGQLRDSVERFAESQDASVRETRGTGEFIGSSTRSASRSIYRQIISQYEQKGKVRIDPKAVSPAASRPGSLFQYAKRLVKKYQEQESQLPFEQPPTTQPQSSGGARRAPQGGVVSRGLFYPGGKFLPSQVFAQGGVVGKPTQQPRLKQPEPVSQTTPTQTDHRAVLFDRAQTFFSSTQHNIPDPLKDEYLGTMKAVLHTIPHTALEYIQKHQGLDTGFKFYPDIRSLSDEFLPRVILPKGMKREDFVLGGAYDPHDGSVHLDGDKPPEKIKAGFGSVSKHEIYAHEIAHAIDGPNAALSGSKEWLKIYNREFRKKQLNEYSSTNEMEAFAEFARVVWLKGMPEKSIQQYFPRALVFFKQHKLI